MNCPSCELLMINSVLCHETGCPDNHLFCMTECKWCGTDFQAENNQQEFCCDDCAESYNT